MTGVAAQLLLPQILRGFPQVFAVAPAVTLGLGSLPPERLKYASGLFNMMRNLGGAVGIAVAAAIINDRTNLHFDHIASHLTPANRPECSASLGGIAARYGALPGAMETGERARDLRRCASSGSSPTARPRRWPIADAFRAIMLVRLHGRDAALCALQKPAHRCRIHRALTLARPWSERLMKLGPFPKAFD